MVIKGRDGTEVVGEWVQAAPALVKKRRLIGIVGGMEKTGKTRFATSAKQPVYVLGLDKGADVVNLIVRETGAVVYLRQYRNPRDLDQKEYEAVWEDAKKQYTDILKQNKGSLVVDTETSFYELQRYARFGKIEEVAQRMYQETTEELKAMLDDAFDSDMDVVFTRRVREVWANTTSANGRVSRGGTGTYEDHGWGQMPYIVDARVWTYRCGQGQCATHPQGNGFHARIRDNRWNSGLIGLEMCNETPPFERTWENLVNLTF